LASDLTDKRIDNDYRGRTRERSEEADRQVLVAARDGSTSRIRSLFNKKDAHGWSHDDTGMTALHHACASRRDDVEILKVLLEEGSANVNALNKAGESPLRLAINRKGAFSATVRYLRDCGGRDLGPPPRQTSPVRQASRSLSPQWPRSKSPPIRQASRYVSPLSKWRLLLRPAENEEDEMELRRQRSESLIWLPACIPQPQLMSSLEWSREEEISMAKFEQKYL
jgi:hypothetical protein